jgi:hypothetical protein
MPKCEQVSDQFVDQWIRTSLKSPPLLFHYSTLSGVRGIVSSKALWGTLYKCLDDASEVTHGIDLFIRAFKKRKFPFEAIDKNLRKNFIELLRQEQRELRVAVFITSFCGVKENDHQWENYGQNGRGACIEFDASAFSQTTVMPALYRKTDKNQLIKTVMDQFELLVLNLFGSQHYCDQCVQHLFRAFLTTIVTQSCRFKKQLYEPEQEWRVIQWEKSNPATYSQRSKKRKVIFYKAYDLDPAPNYGINEISIGSAVSAMETQSLRGDLNSNGFSCPTSQSLIRPVRLKAFRGLFRLLSYYLSMTKR